MATTSNADSAASDDPRKRETTVVSGPDESADARREDAPGRDRTDGNATRGAANGENGGSSLFDKLDTAGTVIWVGFLAAIVVFTLIPVVGLAAGFAPFAPPPTGPYFAFVGAAFVGTVALVGGAILDV